MSEAPVEIRYQSFGQLRIASYGLEMKMRSPGVVSIQTQLMDRICSQFRQIAKGNLRVPRTMMFLSLAAVVAIMCVFSCCAVLSRPRVPTVCLHPLIWSHLQSRLR